MSELIKGEVIYKSDIQTFKNYSKRTLVVMTTSEPNKEGKTFTDEISIDFGGASSELLDSVNVGDQVDVSYNLRGSCYEKDGVKKWFTSINGWKCFITKKGNKQNTNHNVKPPIESNDDDLPF